MKKIRSLSASVIIFILFSQQVLHTQLKVDKILSFDSDAAYNLKFSDDEKYLALIDNDSLNHRRLFIWNLPNLKKISTLKISYISDYCFHPNNKQLIVIGNFNEPESYLSKIKEVIGIINIPSNHKEKVLQLPEESEFIKQIKITKDARYLIFNSSNGIYIYGFLNHKFLRVIPEIKFITFEISPDDSKIICIESTNQYFSGYCDLSAYKIDDGSKLWSASADDYTNGKISFSRNGSKAIIGNSQGKIGYFDLNNGNLIREIQGDHKLMIPIAVCPDEVFAAVGSGYFDELGGGDSQELPLSLINLSIGKVIMYLDATEVKELTFSLNGKYLASLSHDIYNPDHFRLWQFTYQPAFLNTDIKFDDSLTGGNGMLDNGEEANLILNIKNSGMGSAFGMIAYCSSDDSLVSVPSKIKTGALPADSTNIINIPILADKNAKKGFATIRIELTEANGNDAQPIEFKVPVNRVEPPLLSISDQVIINDVPQPKPLTGKQEVKSELEQLVSISGNGNRLVENDETVEAVFEITNEGLGFAYGVKLLAETSQPDIKIHRPQVIVGDIAPSGKIKAAIAFSTPRYFQYSAIDFTLKAVDNRASIPEVRKNIQIDFKQRYPYLTLNYKIFDGTSNDSRGNSNGLLDQGEIIELAVSVANQGNFKAKNVTVDLNIDKEGIIIQKGNLYPGDIDISQSIQSVSFLFTIQRRTEPGLLPIKFILRQSDFKDEERILNLEILEEGVAKLILKRANLAKGDFLWLQMGLSDVGTIWDILRVPNNPDLIYAATEKKGVLKSVNGGLDWTLIGGNLSSMSVKCLAIDNELAAILYAGTINFGIFKTKDEGLSWKEHNKGIKTTPAGNYPECLDLNVHPSNSSLIYLTTSQGVYKSTNGGEKWKLLEPTAEGNVSSLLLLDNFQDLLYLGMSLGKLMFSMDGGSKWSTLFSSNDFLGIASSILSLAINPLNRESILIGTMSGDIFQSNNSGNNWQKIDLGIKQSGKISSIQYDPINSSILYLCKGNKIFKSVDSGKTWFDFNAEVSKTGNFIANLISIDKFGNIIASGENGIFKLGTVENTQTFADINFEFNRYEIKTDANRILLNEIAEKVINNPRFSILIEGHTDNVGPIKQNLLISEKRAESVAKYLESKGIDSRRIAIKGYGMSRPIAPNEIEVDRMKNRRVEIILIL